MFRITLSILIVIFILFVLPGKIFKSGYFHPKTILFYETIVNKPKNMNLEWLFVDSLPVSLYFPYLGFNKKILEFIIASKKAIRISLSFRKDADYILYNFSSKNSETFLSSLSQKELKKYLSDHYVIFHKKYSTIKSNYLTNRECSIDAFILKEEDTSGINYTLHIIKHGSIYPYIRVTSNKKKYFNSIIENNCN